MNFLHEEQSELFQVNLANQESTPSVNGTFRGLVLPHDVAPLYSELQVGPFVLMVSVCVCQDHNLILNDQSYCRDLYAFVEGGGVKAKDGGRIFNINLA